MPHCCVEFIFGYPFTFIVVETTGLVAEFHKGCVHSSIFEDNKNEIVAAIGMTSPSPAFYRLDVFLNETFLGKLLAVNAWTMGDGEIDAPEPFA